MRTRRVIGVMTGTSIDGIDLALVEIHGEGLAMRVSLVRARSSPLGALAPRLRAAAEQSPLAAREFASLALDFGVLHAREAEALSEGDRIDLVVAHGQTVFHAPPVSWQLLNPFPIAAALGCRVICDLRQADLAAGGQGAPITPLSDWILFRGAAPRVVLNLGGFANATALPPDAPTGDRNARHARAIDHARPDTAVAGLAGIRGGDLCVCNQLLDRAAQRVLQQPFDRDGLAASRGRAHEPLADALANRLARQRESGRSLGTGDELFEWIDSAATELTPEDTLATAVAALANAIASGVLSLEARPSEVIVAGGGAYHRSLIAALAKRLGCPVVRSDDRGVPISMREAMSMAVLGALAEDGLPISLKAVTGRGEALVADGARIGQGSRSKQHDLNDSFTRVASDAMHRSVTADPTAAGDSSG